LLLPAAVTAFKYRNSGTGLSEALLMSFLKRPASIVITSAALAAATVLGMAVPASAAQPSWTISKGGAVKITAKSFTLEDVTAGFSLPCKSSVLKGKLKSGKKLPGKGAGTLTSAATGGCSTNGFTIVIKATHLPWKLNLVSYNAKTGVTTATATGLHLAMSVPGIGCSAAVDGTGAAKDNGLIKVAYSNKTGKLTTLKTGGNLHLYAVKSCLGLVNNGDTMAISATYTVSQKQKITSP
jgi:hypothetical protein